MSPPTSSPPGSPCLRAPGLPTPHQLYGLPSPPHTHTSAPDPVRLAPQGWVPGKSASLQDSEFLPPARAQRSENSLVIKVPG